MKGARRNSTARLWLREAPWKSSDRSKESGFARVPPRIGGAGRGAGEPRAALGSRGRSWGAGGLHDSRWQPRDRLAEFSHLQLSKTAISLRCIHRSPLRRFHRFVRGSVTASSAGASFARGLAASCLNSRRGIPNTVPIGNGPMAICTPSLAERSSVAELRPVDRDLLLALRGGEALGVGALTDRLGVTATAIRQRVERLLSMGLIEREKVVAGRGRPTFLYRLTVAGHRRSGADPAELADAMWEAILAMPDSAERERLLSAVGERLGRQYADLLSRGDSEGAEHLAERFERLSELLSQRQVESGVSRWGDLPVLDVGSCPYPSMTEASGDRAMCKLEEKMFSEALGQPVHLSSCRLDGDACCQFAPVAAVDRGLGGDEAVEVKGSGGDPGPG